MSITRTAPLTEADEARPDWAVLTLHVIVLLVLVTYWGLLAPFYLGAVLRRREHYLAGFLAVAVNAAFLYFVAPRLVDGTHMFAGLASTDYWASFPKEVGAGMAGSRIVAYMAGIVLGMAWRLEDSQRVGIAGAVVAMALLYGGHRIAQAPLDVARSVVAIDVTRDEYVGRFDAALKEIRAAAPSLDQAVTDRIRNGFVSRPTRIDREIVLNVPGM